LYWPAELFNDDVLPASVRTTLRERRGTYRRLKSVVALSQIEAELYPVTAGTTNDALLRLIPAYRGAGFAEHEAAARFAGMLARDYDGELTNPRRLLSRIHSLYVHAGEAIARPARARQTDLFTEPAAEAVAALYPDKARAVQRRATIQRLVTGILDWKSYLETALEDPLTRSTWAWLYPYSVRNWKAGYTPLPKTVLNRIDSHYHRTLSFLQENGFLEASPFPYVPGAGICNYYRVREERFTC